MKVFLCLHPSASRNAASAGRISHRKQVTMKIISSISRQKFRNILSLGIAIPFALGLTHAQTTSSPAPAAIPSAAKPKTVSTTSTSSQKAVGSNKKESSTKTADAGSVQHPALVPTPQSPASATAPEPPVTTLPTIVVTAATRESQPPNTTATTTTVLTQQFLDASKYASVPDALQSVPGLSVVTTGMPGAQTSVFIHGLESRQTLVTIDGRRQAPGLSGADDNLANLTLDNVDQIEVVRTPVSSSQGGSAMGGVINLVTLSGKGLPTPESSASVEAGSFNTYRENIQSRGAVGGFDYAVSTTRQDSIYPALSPGDGAFNPGFTGQADQYRNTTYRGNFGYQLTPDVYVDVHTAYNNAYTSSPGSFTDPDPTANLLIEDWNVSPEIVAKVTDFYSTKLYYTRDQQRQVYNDPYSFVLFGGGQGDLTRTQINTDSVDWQNDFQIAHNWSITTGLQSDNQNYYQFDDGLGMRTFDGHQSNIGGYISSQYQPLPGLNILTSGRYDAYSNFGGAFSWRQGVSYLVAPTQTVVHASVSRAFTPPPLQDTVESFPPFSIANPNLQPETDLGWEVGVEQPLWDGRITPSATYFHNDVHNSIQTAAVPGSAATTEENVNEATTDGVEVGVTVKPWPTVSANVSYTYLNAVNDATQMRLVRRPRNDLQFTGIWNPIPALTFTLGGNWMVGRQDLVFDPVTFASSQVPVPDYFILRASATYQINDRVSIWVRGENLTDRNYQPVVGYYGPSIAGYGGIKVTF
jgi:vitamin B12 transporter